ncbi:reverse transcriptase domain-containing protein [Tanacetum coccineum]
MVMSEGIRANPKKTKAVADMQSPKTLKEMQSLSGKLAALNRFLSRSARRALPFFDTLKNITKRIRMTSDGRKRQSKHSKRIEYTYAIRLNFTSTNNKAEYEALLTGLWIAGKMKVQALKVKVDSKVVACQLDGEFVANSDGMTKDIGRGLERKVSRGPGNKRHCRGRRRQLDDPNYQVPRGRYVGPLQASYIIREVHEGACEMHVGAQSVVAKTMRQGYYWLSMHRDTKEVVDRLGPRHLGPLPEGPGRLKFIIVTIDYFTKWMEAKPLAKNTGKEVKKFVWENIKCSFGLPRMNTAVVHPQANDLVERANKSLMHGLKARLGRERVGWVDELPNILRAHRTMLKTSNGKTPFSLTYGSEAVSPTEIGMPTYRTIQWNEAHNEEEMRLNLDLIQERRETAAIREAKYKKKVEQY